MQENSVICLNDLPAITGADLLRQGRVLVTHHTRICPGEAMNNSHWHDVYELGCVLSGEGCIRLADQDYVFQAGQVYVINDIEPHAIYSQSGAQIFMVHFHPSLLLDSWTGQMRRELLLAFQPPDTVQTPLLPLNDPTTKQVYDLLLTMKSESLNQQDAYDVVISGLLSQAAGYLARRLLRDNEQIYQQHRRRQVAYRRIQPVLELIESNYMSNISLDDMAETACVSRSHCCTLFQVALGTTPIAYRNGRRLIEARRLLRQTDQPVREIAFQIGFGSVQEFNRLFHRETSMTPTAYRRLPDGNKLHSTS